MDNPQALTSNGVFKAMTIRDWLTDNVKVYLDRSNFHYYPFVAVLCHLLDLVGIETGNPRRQIALINCLFGAISLCIVYLLVRAVGHRRDVAWAAVTFHLGGAFFLNLSISNEDIIPSYTFLLGSLALAAVWFVNPTPGRIAIVALVFTLSWLFEWRLMFPTLPALLVGVTLAPGTLWKRLLRVVLFLTVMVGTAEIVMQLWGPHEGNAGSVRELLWTGKAVESGWGGFTARKLVFLWVGITEYLLGGTNLGDASYLRSIRNEVLMATVLIAAIAVAWLVLIWRDATSLNTRVLAAIFGMNFLAGEIFNFYSQPQDPQMQINVMICLTVAWAAVVAAATHRYGPAIPRIALVLAAVLLSYNIHRMVPARGADGPWRSALERLERRIDPARTVFLVHGFEQLVSEAFYEWHGEWNSFGKLGPAPAPKPKFKAIALADGPIHQPSLTDEELAAELSRKIGHAIDLGYEVVADYVWELSEPSFISSMATVADSSKAATIYRTIHTKFTGTLLFEDPLAGTFFRVKRAD